MLLTHSRYGVLLNFVRDGDKRVFSEVYEYLAKSHMVERLDIRYIGVMTERTEKPWQPFLDAKRKKGF